MYYFLWFWITVISRAFFIIFSRKKETRQAYRLLENIEKEYNGKFNPATLKKIAVSYGIYLPMVCKPFIRLKSKTVHEDEKIRYLHYFICSSLFDDFTDEELLTEKQLIMLSFHYDNYECDYFDESVFKESHRMLRNFVKDKKRYDEVSRKLFEAQKQSKRQYRSHLSHEKLRQITFNKGGYAVLLCNFYMNQAGGQFIQECWYRLGVLIQLTNDLYDIHKDLKDEISTLPNTMKSVFEFEHFFIHEIEKMKNCIPFLPVAKRQKQNFSLSMAGIYAFGLIALHQIKQLQGTATEIPNLHQIERNKLIIDMEKPKNLLLWFKYTYKYAKI